MKSCVTLNIVQYTSMCHNGSKQLNVSSRGARFEFQSRRTFSDFVKYVAGASVFDLYLSLSLDKSLSHTYHWPRHCSVPVVAY